MHITVLTPDKKIFEGNIVSVKVPGTLGQFQVLKNHAPIVSSLGKGVITLVTASGTHQVFDAESSSILSVEESGKHYSFNIEKGFIEVLNNEIALLVQGIKLD